MNGISFEIKGTSDKAGKSIKALEGNLKKLNQALNKTSAGKFASSVNKLAQVADKLNSSNIVKMADALRELNTIDISGFVNAMKQLTTLDFSNLKEGAAAIREIADSLKRLQTTKSVSWLSVAFGAFKTVLSGIGSVVGGVIRLAKNVASGILNAFKQVVSFLVSIPGRIKKAFVSAFQHIRDSATKLWSNIKQWYSTSLLTKPIRNLTEGLTTAAKKILSLGNAIKRIVFYRLIRTLVKEITQGVKTGIENLYAWSSSFAGEFSQSMNSMATSMLYFKNSIGAMVAPLLNALAPALEWVTDRAVDLLNVINQLFARLTGQTYWTKAIRKAVQYGDAVSGAGQAAKEAMRYLAPFDELNVLPDNKGSGGGGGTSTNAASGMFENITTFNQDLSDFAGAIRTAIENADWTDLGTLLGSKLTSVIDGIDWKSNGKKVGGWINALFTTTYWTLNTADWVDIGGNVVQWLNGVLDSMTEPDENGLNTFEKWGGTLTGLVTAGLDMMIGAFTNLDTAKAGNGIKSFLTGVFNSWTDWFNGKDWGAIATETKHKISNFFTGLDFASIAKSFFTSLGSGFSSALQFLDSYFSTWEIDYSTGISRKVGFGERLYNFFKTEIQGKSWSEIATTILTKIGTGFSNLASWVDQNVITPFLNGIGLGSAWERLKDVVKNTVLPKLKDGFGNITKWVQENIIDKITEALKTGDWSIVFDAETGIFASLKAALPDAAAWAVENIINPIGKALSGGEWQYADDYMQTGKRVWVRNWEGFDASAIHDAIEAALSFDVGDWIMTNIVTPITTKLDADFWKGIFEPILAGLEAALASEHPTLAGLLGITTTTVIKNGQEGKKSFWDNLFDTSVTNLYNFEDEFGKLLGLDKYSSFWDFVSHFWAKGMESPTEDPNVVFMDDLLNAGVEFARIDPSTGLPYADQSVVKIPVIASVNGIDDEIDPLKKILQQFTANVTKPNDKIPVANKILNNFTGNLKKVSETSKTEKPTVDMPGTVTVGGNDMYYGGGGGRKAVRLGSYTVPLTASATVDSTRTYYTQNGGNKHTIGASQLNFKAGGTFTGDRMYYGSKDISNALVTFKSKGVFTDDRLTYGSGSISAAVLRFAAKGVFTADRMFYGKNKIADANVSLDSTANFTGKSYASTFSSYIAAIAWFKSTYLDPSITYNDALYLPTTLWVKDIKDSFGKSYSLATGGVYKNGAWSPIESYAGGGLVGGQLFRAREAGPELVGTLKGHTAVMNNDQIVASVSAGVARAISSIQFHMNGYSPAYASYSQDEDTEEAMYRAFMRAMQSMGISGDITAHISEGEVYDSVRRANRANTRMTGVNALS